MFSRVDSLKKQLKLV